MDTLLTDLDTEGISERMRQMVSQQYTNSGKKTYSFQTDDDIIQVLDTLVAKAANANIFPVLHVSDPRRMMQMGLWPSSISLRLPWITYWLEGMSMHDISFWTDVDYSAMIRQFRSIMSWEYSTLQTIQKQAVASADSTQLRWRAPEMLYTRSQRPRNDMSLFRSPMSHTTQQSGGDVTLDGEQWHTVPVTRYAEGMSRGLFYEGETPSRFCGTFYYLEEESSTLLSYRTALTAFNKTDACEQLGVLNKHTENYSLDDYDMLRQHIDGYFPRDLILTPVDVNAMDPRYPGIDPVTVTPTPMYAGKRLGLYAAEDGLDQILCNAARSAGYDIVILEAMVGSFQVVTEVLDTRSRQDSLRSLVYVVQ